MNVLDTIPYREGNAVVLSCDRKYMDYAIVTMQSWLETAKEPTCFHVITDDNERDMQEYMESNLKIPSGSSLDVHQVDSLFDFEGQRLYTIGHITKATYYRLLIPSVMPDYSRAVYLDSDTCVVESIEEVFGMEMSTGEIVAGVEDFAFSKLCPKRIKGSKGVPKEFHADLDRKYGTFAEWYSKELGIDFSPDMKYMNGGMVLFDIPKCNAYGLLDKAFTLIKEQTEKNGWIYFADQDALNSVCNGRIKWLPITWNALWYFCTHYAQCIEMHRKKLQKEAAEYKASVEDSARLWHYITRKPWDRPYFNYKVASHWWRACSHTPLFEKHLSKLSSTVQKHVLESIEDGKTETIDQFL